MRDFDLDSLEPSTGFAVVQVTGELDISTAPLLRERTQDLIAQGVVHIIIDMSRVIFLDAAGLGVLVGALKRVRAHDGSLTVVINAERILRIFQVTGLSEFFPPHPSVRCAMDATAPWRRTAQREAGTVEAWCHQHNFL